MAMNASFSTRVLAGSLNLSCEARNVSVSSSTETLDTTTLCETAKTYITGMDDGTFSADGPLDVASSTNEPYDIYTAWKGSNVPITYGPAGLDVGDEAWLLNGFQTEFSTTAAINGTVDFSLAAQNTGALGIGKSAGLETITATGNGSAANLGSAGASGATLHLHVTSFSGFTSDTVSVEHSTDGATGWTTLGTFTAATGVTNEIVTVSGAVKQYVRAVDTCVGSGTIIRGVAVALL